MIRDVFSNTFPPPVDAAIASLGSAAYEDATVFEEAAKRGEPDGYADLDGDGHVPVARIATVNAAEVLGTDVFVLWRNGAPFRVTASQILTYILTGLP